MASFGISIGLNSDLWHELNRIAERDKMSVQDVIRRACRAWIDMDKGKALDGGSNVLPVQSHGRMAD